MGDYIIKVPEEGGLMQLDGLPEALREYVCGPIHRPHTMYTCAVPWDRHAEADPVATLMAVRGLGRNDRYEDYGSCATAFLNRTTFAHMLANENPTDLYGLLQLYQRVERTIQALNALLRWADLPLVEVFDRAYYDRELKEYRPVLRDGAVIVSGRKVPDYGQPVGDRCFTVINV